MTPCVSFLAALVVLLGAAATRADDACGAHALCGFERPEDLAASDAGGAVLVSEYGSLDGQRQGRISVLDPASGTRRVIYPSGGPHASATTAGQSDCPGPPGAGFSPHGLHLAAVKGERRLLVVNHGGREAVEVFAVRGHDAASLELEWRDCVVTPPATWMNDVVGLPDGGFAVSHMVAYGTGEDALFALEAARSPSGRVLRWKPGAGWSDVPGSAGGLPNGLELSPDGRVLYINEYFGDAVTALELATGRRLWRTPVPAPDNSSWSADGYLLVASHTAGLVSVFECNSKPLSPCPLPSQVVALRASDGAPAVLIDDNSGLQAVTVALEVGDRLYLGSFVGDRLWARPRPAAPAFAEP